MGRKGEQRKQQIILSATACLLQFGDRKTTFQLIADHARVSQALVIRYLEKRENIFPIVLDYWISWAREKTESALKKSGSPEERLRDYLRVSIELFVSGEFSRIYLLLHYFAGIEERYRILNSEIKNVAVARVSKILEGGVALGDFRKLDIQLTAKTIHNDLVGHVLSAITETHQSSHVKLASELEEHCIAYVRA